MIRNIQSISLNEGQTLASEGFFQFLLGPEKELKISGPGGVGKTFTMGYMIDEIMPRYFDTCKMMGVEPEYDSIQMTATTNKAAEVLGLQTGRPASTVHAYFGLKVFDDYATGESKVEKSKSWTVHSRVILFIDEASMIDQKLYDLIQEGTFKSKIVYVGDKDQLAPVKESLSPVYRKKEIPMFELLEPMRTSIPELQALNAQCRATVNELELRAGIAEPLTMQFAPAFRPIVEVPGIIDFIDEDGFYREIEQHLVDPNHNHVVLAYTNARVIDYNSYIRSLRGLPDHFTVGEELISSTAGRFGKYSMSVEDEITIVQMDDQIELVDVAPGAQLAVRFAMIENGFGDVFRVPLVADRNHHNQLIKYYKSLKQWSTYYNLKNNYPDLRQKDARTVYKIQGSSVDTVYIDATNLSTCHNPAQAARLIYVAVSRARKRVVIYGKLADKYGGLISAA